MRRAAMLVRGRGGLPRAQALTLGAAAGRDGVKWARTAPLRGMAGSASPKGGADADGGKQPKDQPNDQPKDQQQEQQQQEQQQGQQEQPGGFFSQLRSEFEKNPEIKRSMDELRGKSKTSSDSASGAAEEMRKSAADSAGRFGESVSSASEEAKRRASATGEGVKEASANVGSFLRDLRKELGLGGDSTKSGGADSTGSGSGASGSGAETAGAQPSDGSGSGADGSGSGADGSDAKPAAPSALRERLSAAKSAVLQRLPESFGSDDRTWDEALRSVFGMRVARKPKRAADADSGAAPSADPSADPAAAADAELPEWFEAVDKESGDVYFYNTAGETVWERPSPARIVRAPESEAHEFVEAERAADAAPSFLEQQIAAKGARISELEDLRDEAMAASDTARFKELNSEIKALRRDIERLSAQASSTAVVFVEEKKGAWEQFSENLREAPLLRDIFGLADSTAVRKARDAAEDAREALETSQNPLVYRMYSVYDSVFGETEMGEAVREFRRLDPEFTMEAFVEDVQYELAPKVVSAFLRGDAATIDAHCSEGAGAAVKAAIRDRKAAGRRMDEHILSIGDVHVAAAKVVDKMGPMIVVQFMVQQINCMYNLKGEVVDGKEDEIVGVFYIFALTLEYDEETRETAWKIKEFAIGGTTPWI